MILTAMRSVLYRSTQYEAGDALPADNADMVEAWIQAGSAVWKDEDQETKAPAKARRTTAPPGTQGISSDGDPEARVGRIPDKPERKRPSRSRKGTAKK